MQGFRHGHLKVLVATDIAARGIDVPGVSHVFNYELPNVPEQYVHRIGRTARAGADGQAFSFVADDERGYLKDIERLTKVRLMPVGLPEGFRAMVAELPKPVVAKREEPQRRERPAGEQSRRPARRPRPERGSGLMSRDGYGRDEIPVSDRGPLGNPVDAQRHEGRGGEQRRDRGPRADNRGDSNRGGEYRGHENRGNHKRGGPAFGGAKPARDGGRDDGRPRNYGPKPSGVGKFKKAVKRVR
jgi:ATP-dependent RNA helicase RhlE